MSQPSMRKPIVPPLTRVNAVFASSSSWVAAGFGRDPVAPVSVVVEGRSVAPLPSFRSSRCVVVKAYPNVVVGRRAELSQYSSPKSRPPQTSLTTIPSGHEVVPLVLSFGDGKIWPDDPMQASR